MNNDQELIEEHLYRREGMSEEEMQFYLNKIIKNCNEVCNTINPVDGKNSCDIVEMIFKQHGNTISFNGSLSIGTENRCVEGIIYYEENSIVVDMNVIRLCVECEHKEYTSSDVFKLVNNKIIRSSLYNGTENIYGTVDDEEVKGKIYENKERNRTRSIRFKR